MRREVDELPVPALPCPSLAPQVFAAIPPSVAFDIEVRAALSRSPPPPLRGDLAEGTGKRRACPSLLHSALWPAPSRGCTVAAAPGPAAENHSSPCTALPADQDGHAQRPCSHPARRGGAHGGCCVAAVAEGAAWSAAAEVGRGGRRGAPCCAGWPAVLLGVSEMAQRLRWTSAEACALPSPRPQVSATLAAVEAGVAAYGPRLVLFSSFDPDVCLEVKRRWEPTVAGLTSRQLGGRAQG